MKRILVAALSVIIFILLVNVGLVVNVFTQETTPKIGPPETSKESTSQPPSWQKGTGPYKMQDHPEIRPPEVPRKSPPQLPECKEDEVLEDGKCKRK
jgi:hypothetical protein